MNRAMVSMLFLFCLSTVSAHGADPLRIVILSVGQNDSQLIMGPEKMMLIDAGGPSAQAAYIAENVRDISGKSRLDYFMISHFHSDHLGNRRDNGQALQGLWWLLQNGGITIDTIIDRGDDSPFGVRTSPHEHYVADINGWVSSGKIGTRVIPSAGQEFDLGGDIRVKVLALNGNGVLERINTGDPDRFADFPPSENDYSIAIKISVGEFEYFSAGDLTGKSALRDYPNGKQESYNDIESSVAPLAGDVEVQRVNHHGSGHSSNTLFEALLDPEVAIISSGRNSYNHPTPEAFARLENTARVFVTTDVSDDAWPDRTVIDDNIVNGNIEIRVAPGGSTYTIQGMTFHSFTDADEAADIDAGDGSPATPGVVPTGDAIPPDQAGEYIGENVTIEGTIRSVRVGQGEPSYLNFFTPYWQGVSAVIEPDDLGRFGNIATKYRNKAVRITGTVQERNGRPMVPVTQTNQIKLAE